jgi:hypothetical protein
MICQGKRNRKDRLICENTELGRSRKWLLLKGASLEGEALDPKIEEYRKQGLNKNSTLEMIRRYTQALGFEDVWLRGML